MQTLHSRMKPMMYFCHLYGMGFCPNNFRIIYFLLIFINVSVSFHIYYTMFVYVQTHLSSMFNLSTVTSVVRLHIRFLAHPLMIVFLSVKKTTILNYISVFDSLVLRINKVSLTPYTIHFLSWIITTLLAELIQIMAFHYRTDLQYFTAWSTAQYVFPNVWLVTPVLIYIFLISLVSNGIHEVNNNITSIRAWRIHSLKWKKLQCMSIVLTNSVFGNIIIIFIMYTIMDLTFFFYATYLSWINNFPNEIVAYIIILFVRAGLMFHLFRTTQSCKLEQQMKKTQMILNGIDKTTVFDYKEFQFTSLYMLHIDFSFTPCNIFDITYRNLITIFTISAAYSTFQIQMNPDEKDTNAFEWH
ncbi:uncharacterized protein LOC113561217 isoform X2 [Rhopalosiphum maidis]|uniref:uncharacterized protein LOC113561217 isoform X2 n=1 Tax=Rhopalosiphum maidis TaxID=43146 RepID=UPI000EFDE0C1|nr:uncharacterized protein LOC113561217 isoform X2 [Rhopalosiphum maidis]